MYPNDEREVDFFASLSDEEMDKLVEYDRKVLRAIKVHRTAITIILLVLFNFAILAAVYLGYL
jgi:hypothetical protein